jgi:outer membrane protein OmpA-like peptidoglycan-associated protein
MAEKSGIIAGILTFLGLSLFCVWHHSAVPGTYHSSDIAPSTEVIIPPVASPILPPAASVSDSPSVSSSVPTSEATPAAPSPAEQIPTGQAHSESQTQTLRKQVVEFYVNSDLLTAKGRGTIDSLLPVLRNNPRTRVEIAGHADNVGTQDYNLGLSQRRAEAVKQYFIVQGIAEQRLITQGYGFSLPIADNATAEGRQRNRRAEVIVHSSAAGS